MAKKNQRDRNRGAGDGSLVVLPRRWLALLVIVVASPWLLVAAAYLWERRDGDVAVRRGPQVIGASEAAGRGPWGSLTLTPILLSPPLESISTDWGPILPPVWFFPDQSPAQVEAWLVAQGVTAEYAARVRATIAPESRLGGLMARPDPELVRGLPADVRARIYMSLARSSPYNTEPGRAFRYFGTSVDEWLEPLPPDIRRLVEPLVYRSGGYLYFADIELIRSQIATDEELRRLVKVLFRQQSFLVRLSVSDESEVDALVEYWGRGGRRTDLRPLLESVAGAGPERSIDIAQLLPPFAREHLYRYPKMSAGDLDRPTIANCLWTALNFFNATADDRYLDVGVALDRLKADYYLVEERFELGDIVALLDQAGNIFHVAVYVADDLVLTKNGISPMAPWVIVPLERVKRYYETTTTEPRVLYHRRNDF